MLQEVTDVIKLFIFQVYTTGPSSEADDGTKLGSIYAEVVSLRDSNRKYK
jgi:hypothetical protein